MPASSPEQLIAKLSKGQAVPAIVLLGSDLYLRDLCRSKLIETCVPAASRAWAVTRLSLEDSSLDAALDQAQMLPMLSPRQIIFLSDVDALMRLGDDKRERAEKQLAEYLKSPPDFTVLVLEAESLDQRTKLYKLLSSEALLVEVELAGGKNEDEKRQGAIAASQRMIPEMARQAGVSIDADAAAELAQATNGELARIHTEIEKLATYVGAARKITSADVDALVVAGEKSSVWQLADMLAEGRAGQAFEFLEQLLREGEQPVGLLGGITWMYRKLLEAHGAPRGMNRFAAAGLLKMKPDTAELALRAAQKIPRERLLAGITALYDADSQLKGGAPNHRAVIEFLVAQLTAWGPVASSPGPRT